MRKDAFGGILDCDEASLPVLGWEREHLVGGRSLDYIHPDDHDEAITRWMSMLEEPGRNFVSRYRHLHVSGDWLDVEITNVNTLDTLGSVTSSLVVLGWATEEGDHVVPDGSSELRALHKIRSGERLLRRLAEWLPTGVVYCRCRWHRHLRQLAGPVAARGGRGLPGRSALRHPRRERRHRGGPEPGRASSVPTPTRW